MRKDSKIFLKKLLEYRLEVNQNEFTINYQYFEDIPSIKTAVFDILKDLIENNCLTNQSKVIDLEGDIFINLTLDGITYFDDREFKNENKMVFNVSSGGQVNFCRDNGVIEAVQNKQQKNIKASNQNGEITEDQKKAASLLYHDIKSIERYLAYERSSVNIRYLKDWQRMTANCSLLEDRDISYIYSIYDEVYDYNELYKQKQKNRQAFRKEDISSYKKLQKMIFVDRNSYIDFDKYNPNYESLMNKLKLLKNE